jgi:IS5 family transposase
MDDRVGRVARRVAFDAQLKIVNQLQRRRNRTKAQVRSKVEHVFRIMKRQFGFDRVRYRGLAKNTNRIFACFALVNLYLARKRLAPMGA